VRRAPPHRSLPFLLDHGNGHAVAKSLNSSFFLPLRTSCASCFFSPGHKRRPIEALFFSPGVEINKIDLPAATQFFPPPFLLRASRSSAGLLLFPPSPPLPFSERAGAALFPPLLIELKRETRPSLLREPVIFFYFLFSFPPLEWPSRKHPFPVAFFPFRRMTYIAAFLAR